MVIQVLHCAHCQSQNVIRHGKDKVGRQRYRCHDCRRTFQGAQEQVGHRARRAEIQARALAAYQERASMRGVCRLFGIGRNTLSGWLKKARQLPPLPETLAPARPDDVLELDELWSFVARRRNKRWVWLALCRRTRQVVAYAVGDRGVRTCRLLWERVPRGLRHALTFTDFWEAYQKVVPEGQHVACGKGSGQTNHVERFNNTLRQRLARFVRQTLSFRKSDEMHETCLRLFLHHYNTQMAPGVAASQQHS